MFFGIKGTESAWFKSYLSDPVNGESSSDTRSGCGVPQGPVLEPLLFMLQLGAVIRQHDINFLVWLLKGPAANEVLL